MALSWILNIIYKVYLTTEIAMETNMRMKILCWIFLAWVSKRYKHTVRRERQTSSKRERFGRERFDSERNELGELEYWFGQFWFSSSESPSKREAVSAATFVVRLTFLAESAFLDVTGDLAVHRSSFFHSRSIRRFSLLTNAFPSSIRSVVNSSDWRNWAKPIEERHRVPSLNQVPMHSKTTRIGK